MSFSTNFQPIFQHAGEHYYDNVYSAFPEPPEARAQAELARLNRALVVPEFADSTPSTSLIATGFLLRQALTGLGSQQGPLWFRGFATAIVMTGFISLVWMM